MSSEYINQLITQLSTTHQGDIKLWEDLVRAVKEVNMHPDELAILLKSSDVKLNNEYSHQIPGTWSDDRIYTLLSWAAENGYIELVDSLIKAGADIMVRDPLGRAIIKGQTKVVSLLLIAGRDPNIRCRWGSKPLTLAASYGREEIVNILLSHENMVDVSKDKVGGEALRAAASAIVYNIGSAVPENASIVKTLLAKRVNIESTNDRQQTALHTAAIVTADPVYDRATIIKILLEHGASVNPKDNHGNTPLHLMVNYDPKFYDYHLREESQEIVKMLVKHGANMFERNDTGQTPLDLAANKQGAMNIFNEFIARAGEIANNVIRHINGETLLPQELAEFKEFNKIQHNLLVTKIRERNADVNAEHQINQLRNYMEEQWLNRLGISKGREGTETEANKGAPWKEGVASLATLPQSVLQNIGKFLGYDEVRPATDQEIQDSATRWPPPSAKNTSHAEQVVQRSHRSPSTSRGDRGGGGRGVP